jgi:hypothetical protein
MDALGLFQGIVRDALGFMQAATPATPATFYRSNLPRIGLYDSASDTGSAPLTTQIMTAVPLALAAGDVITNLSFQAGATAAGTPTNWVKATTVPSLMGSIGVKPIVSTERNLAVTSGSALTGTAPGTLASPTVANFVPYCVAT